MTIGEMRKLETAARLAMGSWDVPVNPTDIEPRRAQKFGLATATLAAVGLGLVIYLL